MEAVGAITPSETEQPNLVMVLQFTTEFGTNANIFNLLLATIAPMLIQIPDHETRLSYLNGYLGSIRGRVNSLEAQINEIEGLQAEIKRLEGELAVCGGKSIRDKNDSEAALTGTATENYYARRYGD